MEHRLSGLDFQGWEPVSKAVFARKSWGSGSGYWVQEVWRNVLVVLGFLGKEPVGGVRSKKEDSVQALESPLFCG